MKKMITGVIGSGAISSVYLTNMMQTFDTLEVKCIASAHFENAKKRGDEFGIPAVTVEELLHDPEIEMVVILTPASTHYELAKEALLAGKHVYVEKIMTDTIEKTAELVQLADEKGLYLGSAPDTFLGGAWQTERRLIDFGTLGKISSFTISANRSNDYSTGKGSFLRMSGGDFLSDYGIYFLTAIVSLLGPVKRVGGMVFAPVKKRYHIAPGKPGFGEMIDTPNISQIYAILQFENGVNGTLHMNAESHRVDEQVFKIFGDKGVLNCTDPNTFFGNATFRDNTLNIENPPEPEEIWSLAPNMKNLRGIGPSEMAKAIFEGRKNRASKELAYHVHDVIDTILSLGEEGGFKEVHSTVERPEPIPNRKMDIVSVENDKNILLTANSTFNVVNFYTSGLGLDILKVRSYGEIYESLMEKGETDMEAISFHRYRKDRPWIYEIGKNGQKLLEVYDRVSVDRRECKNPNPFDGTSEICIKVADLQDAKSVCTYNNVKISEENEQYFIVMDPLGNRVKVFA